MEERGGGYSRWRNEEAGMECRDHIHMESNGYMYVRLQHTIQTCMNVVQNTQGNGTRLGLRRQRMRWYD